MPRLVLFDIDGTLVLTGRAGLRALNRACEPIVGHASGVAGVPIAGRTDWIILHDAMRNAGIDMDAELFASLRDAYVANLREEIEHPGEGPKAVMPGVRPLLDELRRRPDVYVGLLTGNFVEGARVKLEYFGLWSYFACGAFGDDASDRNALVPFALRRAAECGWPEVAPADVFVVGDTPHDVACALSAGAVPVGVATGGYTAAQLRESGAGIVFEDLSDTRQVVKVLAGD
jgi:phosphoglycolate phosphatase-like HAD superfamily hydrolase